MMRLARHNYVLRNAYRYLLPATCYLLLAFPALAQSPIIAQVDRTTVTTDEEVALTVTVSGNSIGLATPELPDMPDFAIMSNDISSSQISVVNGQMTVQIIFNYRLRPLKEGKVEIPSISVVLDGQTYRTVPIPIEVLPGGRPAAAPGAGAETPTALAGKNLFVEAGVDNKTPYLGQQITYIFRFYQATDAQLALGRPDYQPPRFTNFWGQKVLSQPYYSAAVDGRDYLVTEVHTALFPANPGPLTIPPARLVIPGDLFQREIVLQTNPVTVAVRPLPAGAPPDFSGGVGVFKMQASLKPPQGKVNEPLTLRLDIEGPGNVEMLTEPPLPELPGWRVFNSQSTSSSEAQGDIVYGRRRFERLIVPGQPGAFTIPAITLSYYDPQAEAYRSLKTDPIHVTIAPGAAEPPPAASEPVKQPVNVMAGDIRHIKPVPTSLESAGGLLLAQPLYWVFWLLPALVVGGVWLWQNQRQRLQRDTAYARSLRARRAAQKILATTGQPGVDGYAAVHHALLGYLSDKLNRPTVGLTNADLINLLQEQHLSQALIEQIEALLAQIEAGRFGPLEDMAMQALVSDTQKLINQLEKSFGGRR